LHILSEGDAEAIQRNIFFQRQNIRADRYYANDLNQIVQPQTQRMQQLWEGNQPKSYRLGAVMKVVLGLITREEWNVYMVSKSPNKQEILHLHDASSVAYIRDQIEAGAGEPKDDLINSSQIDIRRRASGYIS
jgi:hypothetical protein